MNVFEFARDVESSGQRFYGDMAERAGEKGIRNIFGMLAEDEARMLTKLREMEMREGMAMRESRALDRGSNIFAELSEREARLQVASDLDAYRLARMAEQQVVDQYLTAIRRESDPEVKSLLQRIVAMEQQELDELERLCDFVDAPNHFLEWGEFSNLDEFHNFGRYEN
jgi:rubrerythrin